MPPRPFNRAGPPPSKDEHRINDRIRVPRVKVVDENGVRVFGPINLPSSVPYHASQMYAKNILTLVKYLISREGNLTLDREDEIIKETLVTHGGEVVHPRVRDLLGLPELQTVG